MSTNCVVQWQHLNKFQTHFFRPINHEFKVREIATTKRIFRTERENRDTHTSTVPSICVKTSKRVIDNHHTFTACRWHNAVLTLFKAFKVFTFSIINTVFILYLMVHFAQIQVHSPHRIVFVRQQHWIFDRPIAQLLTVANHTQRLIFAQQRSFHSQRMRIVFSIITNTRGIVLFQQYINKRSSHKRIFHSRYTIPRINQQHCVNTSFSNHLTRIAPLFHDRTVVMILHHILILQLLGFCSCDIKFEPPLFIVRKIHSQRFSHVAIAQFRHITDDIQLFAPFSAIIYSK